MLSIVETSMNLKRFVSGSALILLGWLGVTFVLEVPVQRYQPRSEAAKRVAIPEAPALELSASGPAISQLSVSP